MEHVPFPPEVIEAAKRMAKNMQMQSPDVADPENPQINPALLKQLEARKELQEQQQAAVQEPEIKVTPPGPTIPLLIPNNTPTSISDKTLVSLPSGYSMYEFKDLYIGDFYGRHFPKLHAAHTHRSLHALLEVTSDIMESTTFSGPLAFYLTPEDFYYCLYYIRALQSDNIVNHAATCPNKAHQAKVINNELPKESLRVVATMTKSDLVTKYLDHAIDMDAYNNQLQELNAKFVVGPMRMLDISAAIEQGATANMDLRYHARTAGHIRLLDNPDASLVDRIKVINESSYRQLSVINSFVKAASGYGVEESIVMQCKECGHQWRSMISLDARDFLPLQEP